MITIYDITEPLMLAWVEAKRVEIGCSWLSVNAGYGAPMFSISDPRLDNGSSRMGKTLADLRIVFDAVKDEKQRLANKLAKIESEKAEVERQLRELYADTPEDSQEPPDGSGSVSGMLEPGENNLTK